MQTNKQRERLHLPKGVIDFCAGGVAGLCALGVSYPFDTVKTRLQVDSSRFTNAWQCFAQTIRHEGFGGLYKGISAPIAGIAFVNAVCFSSYNQGRYLYDELFGHTEFTYSRQAFGGLICGLALAMVETPFEHVKARLQLQYNSQTAQFSGSWHLLRHILQTYGVQTLYKGLLITLIRNIPGNIAYFTFYETMKHLYGTSTSTILLAGGCSGILFWTCSFGLDSIKSKIQCDALDPTLRKYKGIIDCAQQMYQHQGIRAFYRGFGPTLIRSFPSNAISLTAFETVRRFLEKM